MEKQANKQNATKLSCVLGYSNHFPGAVPQFWDLPWSRVLGRLETPHPLLVLQTGWPERVYSLSSVYCGSHVMMGARNLCEGCLYVSQCAQCSHPSGGYSRRDTTVLLGLVPDLCLFHSSPAQGIGEYRGASPFLFLQDVNRTSLSPWVWAFVKQRHKSMRFALFSTLLCASPE